MARLSPPGTPSHYLLVLASISTNIANSTTTKKCLERRIMTKGSGEPKKKKKIK